MRFFLVTLFFLGSTVSLTRGQAASKLFDAVPAAEREALADAASKDISYQIHRQWRGMYKLYDNQRRLSLEEFSRDMNSRIKLVKFSPTAVTYIAPSDHWRIDGCAVFAAAVGDKGTVDAVITARRLSDGWRLSEVVISPREGLQKCTSESK